MYFRQPLQELTIYKLGVVNHARYAAAFNGATEKAAKTTFARHPQQDTETTRSVF